VSGYANALRELDARLPEFIGKLKEGDLVVITADHGCDPTWPGSDHTREHIPMLFFGPAAPARELAVSDTFSDIGATLAKHLGAKPLSNGTALL
jgi:phosphopentomutase